MVQDAQQRGIHRFSGAVQSGLFHQRLRPVLLLFLLGGLTLSLSLAASPVDAQIALPDTHPDLDGLMAMAQTGGTVRVIVGLNTLTGSAALDSPGMENHTRVTAIAQTQRELKTTLKLNKRITRAFRYIPFITVDADADTLSRLADSPLVNHIELDSYSLPMLDQSALQIGAAGEDGAWAMGFSGYGRTIAVLDTGVDTNHPALASHIAGEACFSTSGVAEDFVSLYSSLCPGGVNATTIPGSGINCPVTVTNCAHGTLIAGAAASGDSVYRGIAPLAKIVAVQVFVRVDGPLCNNLGFPNPCAITRISDQVAALEHVYAKRKQYKIDTVILSLGAGLWDNEAVCDSDNASRKAVVDLLVSAGIPVFAPTGNGGVNGSMLAPACISSVIAVGAVNNSDGVAGFSNVAPFMDFFAPGKAIRSAYPGGGFYDQDGTSMAAPQAAAAYSLLRSATPDMTMQERLNVLSNSGVPISLGYTIPRVDIKAALNQAAILLDTPAKNALIAATPITYRWKTQPGAISYTLSVTNLTTLVTQSQLLTPDQCTADGGLFCEVVLPAVYQKNITYRWFAKANMPGGNRPSAKRMLTIQQNTPAALMMPDIDSQIGIPTEFTWHPIPGGNAYRLIVRDLTTKQQLKVKYDAGLICDAPSETCTLTLTAQQQAFFANGGGFRWQVMALGTLGNAPSPKRDFTVNNAPLRVLSFPN